MKIAFFGTGDFSKNILNSILKYKDIDVSLVISQPDKLVGRKKILQPTPIKILSKEKNIEIMQPEKLKGNTDFFDKLRGLDFIVVVAYGKIVPTQVLESPKYGCINIHGSILPYYRGASPIQSAIKNGDINTGLTIMYMSEGMDEGDILNIKEIEIDKNDNTQDIFSKFEKIGPELLYNTLLAILAGNIKGIKQNNKNATYCSKIKKIDGEVKFNNFSAEQIYNNFRAYTPWPGIYIYYNNKKLQIENCFYEKGDFISHKGLNYGNVLVIGEGKNKEVGIICKGGIIKILQVKLEGKKSMDINSFINGNKLFLDYKFD